MRIHIISLAPNLKYGTLNCVLKFVYNIGNPFLPCEYYSPTDVFFLYV